MTLQHINASSQNISIRDIIADTESASEWFQEKWSKYIFHHVTCFGVKMTKPSAIYGLIILELIIAILGLASGFGLLADPSGKAMGLDVVKDKIPFQNLTLLGLWFIGPYGILPASLALIRLHSPHAVNGNVLQ